jgi:hypothetical protein
MDMEIRAVSTVTDHRARYARARSTEAALWVGRMAEMLGASPLSVYGLRRIAEANAFSLWSVGIYRLAPAPWEAVCDVAFTFTERLAPFDGDPELPSSVVRDLLEHAIDDDRREAVLALVFVLGVPLSDEDIWVPTQRVERAMRMLRDLQRAPRSRRAICGVI